MNKRLLRVVMVGAGDTFKQLANYLSISAQTLSMKVNGKVGFKVEEIKKIAQKYNLTDDQIISIFFGQ